MTRELRQYLDEFVNARTGLAKTEAQLDNPENTDPRWRSKALYAAACLREEMEGARTKLIVTARLQGVDVEELV